MKRTNISMAVLIILTVLPVAGLPGGRQRKETVTVFPFNFKNSDTQKRRFRFIHTAVEQRLFDTGTYDMIDEHRVALLARIHNSSVFRTDSEKDSVRIGSFLSIDYIVMGDVINSRNLVIKLIDTGRKEVIFTKIYDIDNGIPALVVPVVRDINTKLQGYSFTPYTVYVHYSYFVPCNDLADIASNGHGAVAGFSYELPFVPDLLVGAEVEYYHLNGKTRVTHHATLVPMLATIQYRFKTGPLSFMPKLAAGTSYNALYYYNDISINSDFHKRDSFDATVSGGGTIGYSVNSFVSLCAGINYGLFMYENRDNRFLSISCGFNGMF